MQNIDWKLLWKVDKDEDDPEFSSPSISATQLSHRTYTDTVEDVLTQLTKVEGYSQMLDEEFGGQRAPDGRRIQADSDDLRTVQVETLTLDAEEKAPYVAAADLSAHVVFVSESV